VESSNYNLEAPMEWSSFKRMPHDVQREYVQGLIERFGVTSINLAEMFGASSLTVRKYLANEHGIRFTRGKSMKPYEENAWSNFLGRETDNGEPAEVNKKSSFSAFSLEFKGEIDINEIYNSLKIMLGNRPYGRIEIVCDLS